MGYHVHFSACACSWSPCHQQVLGAVGRLVRVERCERVQLITAAARLVVSSCHDCIFYLGVNRAPLLTGDNRFIQVGRGESESYTLGNGSVHGTV